MSNFRSRRRGLFAMDAMVGLALVVMLSMLLAVAATRRDRAQRKLADSRAAVRMAEQVLISLQSGQAGPTASPTDAISILPVQSGVLNGELRWVEVRVTHNGQTASLIGAVPKGGSP